MKKIFEKIIAIEQEYSKLSDAQYNDNTGITRENIRFVLKRRGIGIRDLIAENNVMISEFLAPILSNPKDITYDLALELESFAEQLSGYKENIDRGLAFDIREAVCTFAQENNHDELFIRNTFHKALTLFFMDSELFAEDTKNCYSSIIEYADKYAEYSKDTRLLIAKSFANVSLSLYNKTFDDKVRLFDKAFEFWNSTAIHIDPDFPWEAFHMNLHENFCTFGLSYMRSLKNIHTYSKENAQKVFSSAYYICNKFDLIAQTDYNNLNTKEIKYIYYYYCAQYHQGSLSINQLLDFLFNIFECSTDSYDNDNIYQKLHFSALYFVYYMLNKGDNKDNLIHLERKNIIQADVHRFISKIPTDMTGKFITRSIANFAVGSSAVFNDLDYLKLLLELNVYRHKPTFVHSVMVAKISTIISDYVIKYHPIKFVGLPGITDVNQVKEKASEIIKFVWYSALAHDMGKILYSDLVSFYVRKLNDTEFKMIKEHTSGIVNFIPFSTKDGVFIQRLEIIDDANDLGFIDNSESFAYLIHVALGHHKSYDGKFGYPRDFDNRTSKIKPIIDIVTIADCIDAATDEVGRSYAYVKTLDELVTEFLEGAGTRYSPLISSLLAENKELFDHVNKALSEYRFDTYYNSFFSNSVNQIMIPPKRLFGDNDD